jgi:hypothetical protein
VLDEDLHYYMDYKFFLRMLHKGVRFGTIRQKIARFRLHAGSKTVSRYNTMVSEERAIVNGFAGIVNRTRAHELRFKLLKYLSRAVLFGERMVLRGSAVPFRGTLARQRSSS